METRDLDRRVVTPRGEFSLALMVGRFTTREILAHAEERGLLVAEDQEEEAVRAAFNREDAGKLGLWLLIVLRKKKGVQSGVTASIGSGRLFDMEGSGVPGFAEDPNHQWGESEGFVLLQRV